MSSHDLLERVNEYQSILEKDGYDMMIYGSKWYLENAWFPNKYDTWLAHYADYNYLLHLMFLQIYYLSI